MYAITRAAAVRIPTLRAALDELGDAVVIVGDSGADTGERFSVHVHTCDAGAAVEAGLAVGEVSDIRITCFVLDAHKASVDTSDRLPVRRRAVVTVVAGDGAAELFASEGAHVVRAGPDGTAVDAESIAAAIKDVDAAHVVVMANGAVPAQDLVTVAASARRRTARSCSCRRCRWCRRSRRSRSTTSPPRPTPTPTPWQRPRRRRGAGRWSSPPRRASPWRAPASPATSWAVGVDVLVIGSDQVSAATALV